MRDRDEARLERQLEGDPDQVLAGPLAQHPWFGSAGISRSSTSTPAITA